MKKASRKTPEVEHPQEVTLSTLRNNKNRIGCEECDYSSYYENALKRHKLTHQPQSLLKRVEDIDAPKPQLRVILKRWAPDHQDSNNDNALKKPKLTHTPQSQLKTISFMRSAPDYQDSNNDNALEKPKLTHPPQSQLKTISFMRSAPDYQDSNNGNTFEKPKLTHTPQSQLKTISFMRSAPDYQDSNNGNAFEKLELTHKPQLFLNIFEDDAPKSHSRAILTRRAPDNKDPPQLHVERITSCISDYQDSNKGNKQSPSTIFSQRLNLPKNTVKETLEGEDTLTQISTDQNLVKPMDIESTTDIHANKDSVDGLIASSDCQLDLNQRNILHKSKGNTPNACRDIKSSDETIESQSTNKPSKESTEICVTKTTDISYLAIILNAARNRLFLFKQWFMTLKLKLELQLR